MSSFTLQTAENIHAMNILATVEVCTNWSTAKAPTTTRQPVSKHHWQHCWVIVFKKLVKLWKRRKNEQISVFVYPKYSLEPGLSLRCEQNRAQYNLPQTTNEVYVIIKFILNRYALRLALPEHLAFKTELLLNYDYLPLFWHVDDDGLGRLWFSVCILQLLSIVSVQWSVRSLKRSVVAILVR